MAKTAEAIASRDSGQAIKTRRRTPAHSEQQRQGMLAAAAELFRTQGYATTSMTAIAKAIGLDQSSMYYWFKSKEQILEAVLLQAFETCPFKGKLFHAPAPCDVRMFSLIYRRTYKYCNLPIDVFSVEAAADNTDGMFGQFFAELEAFKSSLLTLIQSGIDDGTFCDMDAQDAACLVLSLIMNQQHLYHRHLVNKRELFSVAHGLAEDTLSEWALHAARIGTMSLTGGKSDVLAIEAEAMEHGWLDSI